MAMPYLLEHEEHEASPSNSDCLRIIFQINCMNEKNENETFLEHMKTFEIVNKLNQNNNTCYLPLARAYR
jgi:hypothetical protein